MDRILYVGPYNNLMSKELFNKAVSYLKANKGYKFYYILPNGKLLVKYRQEILNRVENAFDVNLFTFDNIVDRLLKDKFYINVDRETKEAIIRSVLKDLRDEGKLSYYYDISFKKGFAKAVSGIIGEIKRSLVTYEDYLNKCPASPFYTEIGFIYEEYEKKLQEHNLIDREESFMKALEILEEDLSFFDGLDFIIIDYFFDFRPQELKLLEKITETNCSIYINMPFNRGENFKSFTNTLGILSKMGFAIEEVKGERHDKFEELASILFTKDNKVVDLSENINIIKAANKYLEIKKVAEEVKRHFAKGVSLKDMAIVLTNDELYKDILFQVFGEERIPISLDKEISLIEIPLLKELIQVLEVKKYNMDRKSIINRIKSSYYPLVNKKEREYIEYILRIGSIGELKKHKMDHIIGTIEDEANTIPARATVVEYVNLALEIIQKYKVEEGILNIYKRTKDYNLANRDFSALNKLKEILNSISGILSAIEEEVTLEDFIDILSSYLQNESIVEIQGNIDGLDILTPITARGRKYQVLFVIGMSQGHYPNIMHKSFFFKEDNYKDLKYIGLDVKNYYEILDKEALMFTNIIASCSQVLYLSYSEDSTEDEKSIESIFLDEVFNRLKGDKKEAKAKLEAIEIDYLFKERAEDISTERELLEYILRKHTEGNLDKELLNTYGSIDRNVFEEINMKIKCELYRDREDFNEYKGFIADDNVKEDLYNIHKDKVYSISYLETYGQCPYRFLLSKVLDVEEMEREYEEFTALDLGVAKHELLKEYYLEYYEQIKDYILYDKDFNIDETYNFILQGLEEKIAAGSTRIDYLERKLIVLNGANQLLEFIANDINRMKGYKSKVLPYGFEVPFGKDRVFEIKCEDKSILFTGIIDRIDKYVDEDKYILIDYKSRPGGTSTIEDIKKGLSLQLPLYIMSLGDKEVAAGIYGIISNGKFVETIVLDAEAENIGPADKKGVMDEEELKALLDHTRSYVLSFIEAIHQGDFSINPKKCVPYCAYKDICRYRKGLEAK